MGIDSSQATENTAGDARSSNRAAGRWRSIGLIAVAIIALVAIAYWVTPPYVVQCTDAIAWHDPPFNQNAPRGTQVTIDLENRFAHNLADARVVIDQWNDDTGQDLLIRQVPASAFRMWFGYQVGVSDDRESSSSSQMMAPLKDPSSRKIEWSIQSPIAASISAKVVRLKGRVILLEGRAVKTIRVENFQLHEGASFQVGDDTYVIDRIDSGNDGRYVYFRSAQWQTPIKTLRLLDSDGVAIKFDDDFHRSIISDRREISPAIGSPPIRYMDLQLPKGTTSVNLEVEYWSATRRLELPLTATVPVTHRSAGQTMHLPAGATFSMPQAPAEQPVPASAWGPKAPVDATAAANRFEFRLTHLSFEPLPYPNWECDIALRSRENESIVSYDPVLTGCSDDRGHQLLGSSPIDSSRGENWGVWQDLDFAHPHPGEGAFAITSCSMPAASATRLTLTGKIRIKVGDQLQDVEARNVELNAGQSFALGPLSFTFSRLTHDFVEFQTQGDLGQLREVTIFDANGKQLSHNAPSDAWLYWTNAFEADWDWKSTNPTRGLTVRGKMFLKTRYYDFPFTIVVPLPGAAHTASAPSPSPFQGEGGVRVGKTSMLK